jgi:hypothetical protein
MRQFTFTAYGKTFKLSATSAVTAFVAANRHFDIGGTPGAWMESNPIGSSYRWAEGNFFD